MIRFRVQEGEGAEAELMDYFHDKLTALVKDAPMPWLKAKQLGYQQVCGVICTKMAITAGQLLQINGATDLEVDDFFEKIKTLLRGVHRAPMTLREYYQYKGKAL